MRTILALFVALGLNAQPYFAVRTAPGLRIFLAQAPYGAQECAAVQLRHGMMPPEALAEADQLISNLCQRMRPRVAQVPGFEDLYVLASADGSWQAPGRVSLLGFLVSAGIAPPPASDGPDQIYKIAWYCALRDKAGYLKDLGASGGRNAWVIGPRQMEYAQLMYTSDRPQESAVIRGQAPAQKRSRRAVWPDGMEAVEQPDGTSRWLLHGAIVILTPEEEATRTEQTHKVLQ